MTAYPVLRPDGDWFLMLINKDQSKPHSVRITFDGGGETTQRFSGTVTMITFGSEQYVWHSDGANSHADPENPPASSMITAGSEGTLTLPRASVTVLRSRVGVRNRSGAKELRI
jgi:hypothetical protein